jgi:DNA polymerase family B
MATYAAERIRKPTYFRISPLTRGRTDRAPYVIGFDSEAERGKPFLFQFSHPVMCPIHGQRTDLIDVPLSKHAGLWTIVDYLIDHCTRKDVEYILYGFNLQYEWTQIFHDIPYELKISSDFDVTLNTGRDNSAKLRATNNKRYMASVEMGGTKRRVKLIDAMGGWFGAGHVSLDKAAKIIGAGAKGTKPEAFTRKAARTSAFRSYAEQDAVLTQRLGEYITELHQTYDVPQCVSAPHFAARVFRRRYLSTDIPLPPPILEQFGLDSYHGGKNGFYLHKPVLLKQIWHYDIRSAYPEAMRQLPNPEQSVWEATDHYTKGSHAIYEISGFVKRCTYRAIMHHNAQWVLGRFAGVRVTSYELDAVLALGEITLTSCTGWVMIGPTNVGPLVRYVDDFYALKRNAKTDTEKASAKLFLNSLYGKFFQKSPLGNVTGFDIDTLEMVHTDPEQDYDYEAGGLYHPPIASLITGYVRAKIHHLEHQYQAVMTSTDGFFAYQPPVERELGDELGMLSAEIGTLRIWRERLYVFTPAKIKHEKDCAAGCKQQHQTYALHGFRGKLAQLLRMPLRAGNTYHYTAQAMVTLKMSTRKFDGKRYQPGEFVELPFDVALAKPP